MIDSFPSSDDLSKQLVKIELGRLLKLTLAGEDFRIIDADIAGAFYAICQNRVLCYVQRPDDNSVDILGRKINSYILWDIKAWRRDSTKTQNDRIKSEQERVTRWIFQANTAKIAKALYQLTGIEGKTAEIMAMNMLHKQESKLIAKIGVKRLAEKEEDL
jgi:hypothetical protein